MDGPSVGTRDGGAKADRVSVKSRVGLRCRGGAGAIPRFKRFCEDADRALSARWWSNREAAPADRTRLVVALCLFGTPVLPAKSGRGPRRELRKDAGGSRNPDLVGVCCSGAASPGGSTKEATRARTRLTRSRRAGLSPTWRAASTTPSRQARHRLRLVPARIAGGARFGRPPRAALRLVRRAAGRRVPPRSPELVGTAKRNGGGPLTFTRGDRVARAARPGRMVGRRDALGGHCGCRASDRGAAGLCYADRLAGAFGRNQARDTLRVFPPEKPGAWPERWAPEPGMGEAPRVLKTLTRGCNVLADEPVPDGVVYAETYLDVDQATQLIVSVQGAFAVWVDDAPVLRRDLREWGSWLKFGVRVDLERGRHRTRRQARRPVTSSACFIRYGAPTAKPAVSTQLAPTRSPRRAGSARTIRSTRGSRTASRATLATTSCAISVPPWPTSMTSRT